MTTLIADCEANGFLEDATRLWTIQLGDASTDEVTVYADQPGYPPIADAIERIRNADLTVWHNGFLYDVPLIHRLYGEDVIDPTKVFDTLVGARLLNPETERNSLEDWGRELGILKGEYTGDFQSFTEELVVYARQDIVVTRALYSRLMEGLSGWGSSVETEQRFAWIMALQERNGFHLNLPKVRDLEATLRGELAAETMALRDVFPPKWVASDKEPFVPKRDDRKAGYASGCPLTKVKLQVFNPGSRHQVGERLKSLGWKPKVFNKDGSAKIDDDILGTLPWKEARRLSAYYAVKKKLEQIVDGKSGWLKWVKPDGCVHGRVNTIGCAPGRCAHSKPNMAQVNKKDPRMREVWEPRPGWKLVGVDGEGIQARALSHYLARYDGGAYRDKIINGDKEKRTDEHSSNLQAIPYLNAAFNTPDKALFKKARDGAKTCLYCVLFGGQDPKLGRTVREALRECGMAVPPISEKELGRQARQALFRAIRGFDKLVAQINKKADEKGYLTGLDGRHVFVRSRHSRLVFLMQAAEASSMKLAAVIFHFEKVPEKGWLHGRDFGYVVQAHDEQQIEARPEIAEELGKTFAECVTEAGVRLGLRCPLAGAYDVGDNWLETH